MDVDLVTQEVSCIFPLFMTLCSLLSAWKKGNWGHFDKYYPTLLYFALGNLTYEYIAHSYFHLWQFNKIGLFPEQAADLIYIIFIVIPALFVYLSRYPETPIERILHILKWILIFTVFEWIGGKFFNVIHYHNGWSIWWSLIFNFIMFPMMRLHYLYYKRALLLSVPIIFGLLVWFNYI